MCAKAEYNTKKLRIEDLVSRELHKLPDPFVVLKNVFLRLGHIVTHHRSSESVRSCQIDIVVIGPPGVYVIEAKEWDSYSFEKAIPHKEADQAGLVVYIKLKNKFEKRIPVFNIVTTINEVLGMKYGRVKQCSLWKLMTFIYDQDDCLKERDIRNIKKLLKKR